MQPFEDRNERLVAVFADEGEAKRATTALVHAGTNLHSSGSMTSTSRARRASGLSVPSQGATGSEMAAVAGLTALWRADVAGVVCPGVVVDTP
jgi:hypothetical protein